MRIVGIAGPARSGKDTLAEMLCDEWYADDGDTYGVVWHFADPLKEAAQVAWDLSYAQLHGDQKDVVDERWGVTPRRILQHLGTEHGRALCSDVWERRTMLAIAKEGADLNVIADVRFPNELEAVERAGGEVLWVRREGVPIRDDHASETALLPYRSRMRLVRNDGDLFDLRATARALVLEWAS